MSKGSVRRPEDRKAIAERWPFKGGSMPPFKQRIAYEQGDGWSVGGMRQSDGHAEVFDLWSPTTDKRMLCLCVCAVCGQTWNEGASVEDGYPMQCDGPPFEHETTAPDLTLEAFAVAVLELSKRDS
jgi:hypothetical protein